MKIKKSTNHYKVLTTVFTDVPHNLCEYFQKTVLAYILFIPLQIICFPSIFIDDLKKQHLWSERIPVSIVLYLFAFLIFSILSLFQILWNGFHLNDINRFGLFLLGIITVFTSFYYIRAFFLKRIEKRKEQEQKKQNIVIQYIKAKKQKICPLLEFED